MSSGAAVELYILTHAPAWLQVLQLVEFAFQRYYRLDCTAARGLCERHTRTTERVSAALKPAVALAQALKDFAHPQDQAWLSHALADAALNRFKHLEAGSGLRSSAAPVAGQQQRYQGPSLDEYVKRTHGAPEDQYAVRCLASAAGQRACVLALHGLEMVVRRPRLFSERAAIGCRKCRPDACLTY